MKNSTPIRLIATTAEHCAEFLPGPLPYRIRAFTAMRDGEILGIGGLAAMPDGTMGAFLEVSEETARRYPILLYKAALETLKLARERGICRLYTRADTKREAAERFLHRLGFEPAGTLGDQKIWQWRPNAVENEA
jgi:hypothetical protein